MDSRSVTLINSSCCFVVFSSVAYTNSGFLGSPWLYWLSLAMSCVCAALFIYALWLSYCDQKMRIEDLEQKIAAHEKVCAGEWVTTTKYLPDDGEPVVCVKDGELDIQSLCGTEWVGVEGSITHTLDARMPGGEE